MKELLEDMDKAAAAVSPQKKKKKAKPGKERRQGREEQKDSERTEAGSSKKKTKNVAKVQVVAALKALSLSDESSGVALTASSTTALGPTVATEEAPAPVESMSRVEPATTGAVASFVLDSFQCPLTMDVMSDPVLTVDGQTYERTEIEKWFALLNRTSPLTGETLPSTNLLPNIALRNAIREVGCFDRDRDSVSKNENWILQHMHTDTDTDTQSHTYTLAEVSDMEDVRPVSGVKGGE